MNATRFPLLGASALSLTLVAFAATAQQSDIVDPDVDVIAIEDLESLKNPEETTDIIQNDDGDRDVIAIEDLDSLANPEETDDTIADREETAISGVAAPERGGLSARERRANREDVLSRSDDNMCYHAPFSSLGYCQSWLQSN